MTASLKRISVAGAIVACAGFGALATAGTGGGTPKPDVTLCQLYGLGQFGKLGDMRGLSLATTSWNIGDADFAWFASPNSDHPHIAMNMYRIDPNGRMIQIGQSWIKHGFFALSNTQCGGSCTFEPGNSGGNWLGQNCTDTYGAGLNASQSGLGPRFEINPWTGGWRYEGSMFQQGGPSNNGIRRRLQVSDADLNPALNPKAQYLYEGYYVHFDDINVFNSAAYQFCTPFRNGSGNYTFSQPSSSDFPNIGFAYEAWDVDRAEVIAEELPVQEFISVDGRSMMLSKAIDEGNGQWRYEFAISNIDMNRQVGSFSVPVSADVNVTDIGFYAVRHHDEPLNAPLDQGGIPVSNDAWAVEYDSTGVTWSTVDNPIRWGTMYNFWFTADRGPSELDGTVGLFRAVKDASRPDAIPAPIVAPTPSTPACEGDLNNDGVRDALDLGVLLGAFGTNTDGDVNGDGSTDALDLGILLGVFGSDC